MSVTVGSKGRAACVVNDQNTAAAVGSGLLRVFATPAMIAAMEQAACGALATFLQEGQTSVGTALQIEHTAPTPLGMEVEVTATITAVEGRRVDFTVEARDAVGSVGHGTHSRFLVDAARFQEKADRKGGRV